MNIIQNDTVKNNSKMTLNQKNIVINFNYIPVKQKESNFLDDFEIIDERLCNSYKSDNTFSLVKYLSAEDVFKFMIDDITNAVIKNFLLPCGSKEISLMSKSLFSNFLYAVCIKYFSTKHKFICSILYFVIKKINPYVYNYIK